MNSRRSETGLTESATSGGTMQLLDRLGHGIVTMPPEEDGRQSDDGGANAGQVEVPNNTDGGDCTCAGEMIKLFGW